MVIPYDVEYLVTDLFQEGPEARPDWLQSNYRNPKKLPSTELGEWQCVWEPKSRITSPTKLTRKVLRTLKDDEARDYLSEQLQQQLSMKTKNSKPDNVADVSEDGGAHNNSLPPIRSKSVLAADRSSVLTPVTNRSSSSLSTASHLVQVKVFDKASDASTRSGSTRKSKRSQSVR